MTDYNMPFDSDAQADDQTDQTDLDLFSEELEDRFNADFGSSAACVGCGGFGSSISTLSSLCSGS